MTTDNYRVSKLELKNFRQHRDTKLEFYYDPKKMFAIILGDNGVGKTTIINAITWCLYGKENIRYKDVGGFSIINDNALRQKLHGLVEMSVTLVLADKNGDKFRIERRLRLLNNGSNTMAKDLKLGIPLPKNSTPSIKTSFLTLSESGSVSSKYFELKVGEILPEELSEYFLFDGEKLEDFFKNVEHAKKGIEKISQIDIVDAALKRLGPIRRKIRSSIKSDLPSVNQLRSDLDNSETEKLKIEREISGINRAISSHKEMITTLEKDLANIPDDPGALQRRMNEIKAQRTTKHNSLIQLESKRKNFALKYMPAVQLYQPLKQTLEEITKMYDAGPFPPPFQKYFINDILKKGRCICGNNITQGPGRAIVEKLLKDKPYSEIEPICSELKLALSLMLDIKDVKKELTEIQYNISVYRKELDSLQNEYDNLDIKIKGSNAPDIQDKYKKKKELEYKIIKLNQELGEKKAQHHQSKDLWDDLNERFKKASDKDEKNKILHNKLQFCDKAQSILETTRTKLLDDFRQTVQMHAKTYFLEFLWKKNTFKNLKITPNYEIKVLNSDNTDVGTDILAMGEKLVLALAFMAALRQITGFSFPLLIDSPLGKLGGAIRYNIAKSLPKILHGHQVTLLVTDTEYKARDDSGDSFPSFESVIKNNVGTYYEIQNNDSGDSTIVNKINDYGSAHV